MFVAFNSFLPDATKELGNIWKNKLELFLLYLSEGHAHSIN